MGSSSGLKNYDIHVDFRKNSCADLLKGSKKAKYDNKIPAIKKLILLLSYVISCSMPPWLKSIEFCISEDL